MELFGRDQELAEVAERVLGDRRLVTIIGPGGIGKTALALAAMERLGGEFPLGAHLVDLSRVGEADAVAGTLAAQLGFSSFDALLSSPTDQPALVVVDNCEHVGDAAAVAVAALLARCASPRVLATSRSPLDLPGESILALAPLGLPMAGTGDASATAVRLFLDRARHAGTAMQGLDDEEVGELCRRLDGVPLALEIAAARTRSLAVGDILRLLDDGIDVLARPRFRGAPRQRSLRATIEWSCHLLSGSAGLAFECLGVCAGPFTVGMAAAVVPGGATPRDVVDALGELVDASLVAVDTSGPETRYRMLETVRAVALARLEADGQLAAARDRFVDHVHALVAEVLEASAERWPAEALHRLLDEFDNIAAALRACIAHDDSPDRALPLFTVLWGVIHQAHVDDVADLGRRLRARWPDAAAPHAADAIAVLASAVLLLGQVDEAVAIASAPTSRRAVGAHAPALVPQVLGLAAWYRGDLDLAVGCLDQAVAAASAHGRLAVGMECEVFGALVRADAGAHDEALAIVREVAQRAGATGSTLNELWALTAEGAITAARDPSAARPGVERTLAAAEAVDYPFGITSNLQTLARCLVRTGEVAEAATAVLRLLDQAGRSGRGDLRVALELSAEVADAGDRPEAGALAATAASLPDTSPMRAGGTLAATTTGRALPVSEATRLARRLLATIADEGVAARDAGLRPGADGDGDGAEFRLVGAVWHVRFAGTAVDVTPSKGMADLARLLARPGQEVHCIDLTGAAVEQASTGAVIDATARRRYEERVRELQAEIDEAEELHDAGRAERARVELDALVDHLTAALGRAGRTREGTGTAERARSAVAHRIRSTIRRLGGLHPALGRHLEVSVSTGRYCSYRPERSVDWRT